VGPFLIPRSGEHEKRVRKKEPLSSRGTEITLLYSSIKNKVFKLTTYLIINKILDIPSAVNIHKAVFTEINKIH